MVRLIDFSRCKGRPFLRAPQGIIPKVEGGILYTLRGNPYSHVFSFRSLRSKLKQKFGRKFIDLVRGRYAQN